MPEKSHKSAASHAESFSSYGLDEMYYVISATRDKFEISKFRKKLGIEDESVCFVAPLDPKHGEYHLHFYWWLEAEEVNFRVEYASGPIGHENAAQLPSAEEFMEWFGQFFKYESAQAHVHADFEYPIASKRSKFPLPIKTDLKGDVNAEIEGISIRLSEKPEGVSRVRITLGERLLFAEVIANRRITFKDFALYSDIRALSSVLNMVIEERTP